MNRPDSGSPHNLAGLFRHDAVLSLIASAATLAGADGCSLWLALAREGELVAVISPSGEVSIAPARVSTSSDHPVARALQNGRPLIAVLPTDGTAAGDARYGSGRYGLYVPFRDSGGVGGVLCFHYAADSIPGEEKWPPLQAFALSVGSLVCTKPCASPVEIGLAEAQVRTEAEPGIAFATREPWYRLLLEHANDLIYLHAADGALLYANSNLEEVTGWTHEEMVGRSVLCLLTPELRSVALDRRDRSAGRPGSHRYEVDLLCRDGSCVPMEVHSTPVMENGRAVAWIGIARDIRERRRAQARMAAVYDTARQIAGMLNVREVLAAIVNRAASITDAHSCSLWLLADGHDYLYCASLREGAQPLEGGHDDPGRQMALQGHGLKIRVDSDHPVARALRNRLGTVTDFGKEPERDYPEVPAGTVTVVCLPLEHGHGELGVLSIFYMHPYSPDPDEMALLSTFASHAAVAIDNARLFALQRRKTQEVAAIGQIGMTGGTLDVGAVLHVTGAYTYDLFAADLTVVLLLDEDRATCYPTFIAERGRRTSPDQYQERIVVAEHPILAEAFRSERTLLVDDIPTHPLTRNDARARRIGASTALVVPLVSRDHPMGAILITYTNPTPLSDMQVRLAETLAQQAAVSVDNAAMFNGLAATKREWEATFDAITDAVCIFSTDGILRRANLAVGNLVSSRGVGSTGVQDLIGRHYSGLFYDGQSPEGTDVLKECLLLARPVTREVEDLAIAGVFQVTAYPLLDDVGTCTGVVAYIKDITAQREMQARLFHSARLAGVGELAAGVVHNFKNVLIGVAGTLDVASLLIERGGSADLIARHLSDAQEHVLRGNQVLQRLLDFARGMPQEVSDVHLDLLIADVVGVCKAHSASRGIRIRMDVPPGLPEIQGDAGQLHEVLMNLVLNALQATERGGQVVVGAGVVDDRMLISVADTGCGIPVALRERIFETFYSRKVSGPPGTGIGLSASRNMIQSMGGEITVESQVDEGSTFTVHLPLSGGAGVHLPVPSAQPPAKKEDDEWTTPPDDLPQRRASERVLVVDDDERVAFTTAEMLSTAGFAVTVALSGKEAVARARDVRPEVLVVDYTMPGMRGDETIRQVTAILPGVISIVMSAQDALEPAIAALREDAMAFLPKPFKRQQLVETVDACLRRKVERQRLAALEVAERAAHLVLHNVNHPLAQIRNLVHLAQTDMRYLPDRVERIGQRLSGVDEECRRMDRTMSDFHVLLHPRDEEPDTISTEGFIGSLVAELAERPLNLRLVIAPHLRTILIRKRVLRASLTVLVRNALDVLPDTDEAGVAITVRPVGESADEQAAAASGCIAIDVVDDGPGVAPEAAKRLFEVFFTTKEGGVGVGLSCARHIVREVGGDILYRSEVTSATTFTLLVPASASAE